TELVVVAETTETRTCNGCVPDQPRPLADATEPLSTTDRSVVVARDTCPLAVDEVPAVGGAITADLGLRVLTGHRRLCTCLLELEAVAHVGLGALQPTAAGRIEPTAAAQLATVVLCKRPGLADLQLETRAGCAVRDGSELACASVGTRVRGTWVVVLTCAA